MKDVGTLTVVVTTESTGTWVLGCIGAVGLFGWTGIALPTGPIESAGATEDDGPAGSLSCAAVDGCSWAACHSSSSVSAGPTCSWSSSSSWRFGSSSPVA